MNYRRVRICKAIYLLNQLGDLHKTTVGEIARITGFPYSTVKRNLEWLYIRGVVSFTEYKHNRVIARDFSLTDLGLKYAQWKELFND